LTKVTKFNLTKLDCDCDQFELFKRLYHRYDRIFIFESLVGPKELSESSIVGFDPNHVIELDGGKLVITNRRTKKVYKKRADDPFSTVRSLLPRVINNKLRYCGGAVGYITYEATRLWEDVDSHTPKAKANFPLIDLGIYSDGIIFNHRKETINYFHIGEKGRINVVRKLIEEGESETSRQEFSYSKPKSNLNRNQFIKMVNKAKKYIYMGDIFQVVLSRKLTFELNGDPLKFYQNLRKINPSPYMYFLKMGKNSIVGSSPEMLLRITNGFLETFPIAGTRPAVDSQVENSRLAQELLNDKKEISEHTMLVDLARNDIGKVSKYGSVKVSDLMSVKRFSHVQHIVSHVCGILSSKHDAFDAFRALFPAGTVSGAPKVRAMQIINELEEEQRGPYAGAIGYFSCNGSCDFSISIRSLYLRSKKAYLQAGAGIVFDSMAKSEWNETQHKLQALLLAMKQSKGISYRKKPIK
jgi:anthranilate synthase component 1